MKISFNPSNSNKNILDLIKNNKDIIFDLKGHSIFARGVEFKGTDTNTWRPVVDNLTSDSTTSSLSAKQGKVLKALIDGKSNSDHNHDGRYLKLTGGTMASNALITFADSGSWDTSEKPQGARGGLYWTGQSDYAKLYAEETVGDNLDLVIQFGDDNSNGLSIRNKANTQTSYISSSGVITTGTFKGNLDWSYITNKPATATRWPSWAEVTGKPSSFTPSTHTHGLSNSVFFLNMPSINGNAKWKEVFGYPVNYNLLLSVRINNPAPEWCVGNFGSGILYGGSDTKGFMSSAYNEPFIMWAGGNGSSDDSVPTWYIGIKGTHKSIYNLATIASEANAAYNLRHSHANKSVLDGITSALVNSWNTAYNFVSNITGTDTDKVINKWEEIVNFLAGITEDNKLNTLLNSKLSVYELADNTNVGTIKNNGIYYSTTDASSRTLINSPFNTGFAFINMTSYDGGDDLRRSRLAFNAFGEIKVSDDRDQANTAETWYNVLTSKNSGINGSTIKLNGTSITVYSSGTADGRYVKKSGDTMSGVLTIDTPNFGALTIKRNDDANGASIQFRGKSSVYGYIGLNNSTKDKQFLRWSSDTSRIYTILDTSSTYISNGKGVINGTTITQVDNADTLDGAHLSDIKNWSDRTASAYWKAGWYKVASAQTATNTEAFLTLDVNAANPNGHATLFIRKRADSKPYFICTHNNNLNLADFRLYYNGMSMVLYARVPNDWNGRVFRIISEGREGTYDHIWTLYSNMSSTDPNAISAEGGNPYINPTYSGRVDWSNSSDKANYANSAGSVAWNNVTGKPSAFNPAAHTHTVFKNNLMIKGTNGISDSASIHLGIGDSDTGFKWISDGVCQIYANNAAVGQWTSGGMNWFKNPTVNGNKVWNAGNDGSGSGLDADTLDGEHASSFVRAGHYESNDLNKLDTYSFIRSVNSNVSSTSPKGNTGWYNVIQLVHRNGANDGPSYIGQIALGMTTNTNDMFFRGKRTDPWKTVIHSGNIGNQTVANAYHLRINSANTWSTWYWAGQSSQPSWLWGSNDGTNMYVWNPSNFNVNTAQYLRSLGNQNCQTGGTQAYGDVYSYNTHTGNTGSPTTYSSVIGFGRGIAGTVEIAGGWCNTHLYWRSLGNGCEDWFPWRTVLDSSNYTKFINNYYWANVKISASSSTTTSPTVHTLTATRVCAGHNPGIDNSISCSNWFRSSGNTGWYNTTYQGGWYMSDTYWIRAHNGVGIYTSGQIYSASSIRMGSIWLERTSEINSSDNLLINYRSSADVDLCSGGGNVCIGATLPTQKLDVRGNIITKGLGIQPYYLSKSVLLPTIRLDDGYTYQCLEISATTEISCIIADRAGIMSERGILIKFNKGYDGQIILLKDLQSYGIGNGYFWVMPSGCKIINADNSSILVGQNQISNTYDDGRSRFLVYSSVYSAWIEFLCSNSF